MILFLIEWLKEEWVLKVPTVFSYYSTRMILAAFTSLLVSILLGPYFIRQLYALKIGQTIRKEDCPLLGQLHEKKENTPTMGGILILCAMLVSLFLWMDLTHIFTLILFVTTLVLGWMGGRDDYLKLKYKSTKGMSAKGKLFFQTLLSSFIVLYLFVPSFASYLQIGSWFAPPVIKDYILNSAGEFTMTQVPLEEYARRLYVPFFKEPLYFFKGITIILAILMIFFVITGASNSSNLTDGLDGLAAGCLIMVSIGLACIAFVSNHIEIARYLNIPYIEGSGEIAIYLSALAGACLGFLWYNSYPAQVFMGDTGSLTLGGVIGVAAVLLKKEFLLGIIGGIFVVEALSVILQVASYRLRNKKRIFLCAPIHHHFEYKGWPETKVVIRFWIIGFLLALIGIASLKFQ